MFSDKKKSEKQVGSTNENYLNYMLVCLKKTIQFPVGTLLSPISGYPIINLQVLTEKRK